MSGNTVSVAVTLVAFVGAVVVSGGAPLRADVGAKDQAELQGSVAAGGSELRLEIEESPYGETEISEILLVTGGAQAVETLPGSGHFVGKVDLERHEHSDIHRVLQQVEGVNVQEEDGFGLRPNIGMRGTGVNRSEKITLLEDGVLIAPAPYTAPAAYYFPSSERMEAVEIRKGSSAVIQGPYTTGGVLNLVSTSIPPSFSVKAKVAAGSHETIRAHGTIGESRERFGWLLEGYHHQNEGFKDLDGGGSTGVELTDFVGKVRWDSGSDTGRHQSIELKLGRVGQDGAETYLGLSRNDFDRTPFRRYAASQEDLLETDHSQVQLRYLGAVGARAFVAATAYRNSFFRNWHKLQSVRGSSLSKVLEAPLRFCEEYLLLTGQVDGFDGPLSIRNNRRDYLSEGLETRLTFLADGSRLEHELELGLRLHRDREDRFQEEDLWDMASGHMRLFALGIPGSQSNRVASAEAIAVYLRDTIRLGDWTFTPGARIENIDFEVVDYGRTDPTRSGGNPTLARNDVEVLLPGLGASYRLGPSWSLFGGVHRGFSAPGPGQNPDTDAEESANYEMGLNYRSTSRSGPLGARVVAFLTDYDNLIGRDSLSSGGEGSSRTFNGGGALARGVEAAVDTDLGGLSSRIASIPVRVGYTLTLAEFSNSFDTKFADWAPSVSSGDRMPYLPEHQASLSAGVVADRWDAFLAAAYVGEMRTRPGQGEVPEREFIDRHLLLDLTARVEVSSRLILSLQVRNLLNETYVASRRPAGLRPGLPRTFLIGVTL